MRKLLCSFFCLLIMTGCTVRLKYSDYPIEPPKAVQISETIPYQVHIQVNKNEELSYKGKGESITIIYPVGAMLEDAVNYYLRPMFSGDEYRNIIIEVDAVGIETRHGGSPSRRSCTGMSVRALIYIDNVIASLGISSKGEGCSGAFVAAEAKSANLAAVDAVNKLRREIYDSLVHPDKAINPIKNYIKEHPNDLSPYVALANLLRITRNFAEAIPAAKRAIEINANDPAAYKVLGLTYKELNRYMEAINSLKKAIEINPKDADVCLALSQIYMDQEKYEEAETTLKKGPFRPDVTFSLATTYAAMGKFDEAIEKTNVLVDVHTIKGIGTEISISENHPVVNTVVESGPAKRAGLEAGDRIIKINGQSTKGWDINKVLENMRGPEGTPVTLTIERKGLDKPLEKTVVREALIQKLAGTPLGLRSLINAARGKFEESFKDAEKAYSLDPRGGWPKRAISLASIVKSPPGTKGAGIEEALKILSTSKDSFDRLLEVLAYSKMGDLRKSFEVYASIPVEYLSSKSVFRQHFRNAALESLRPYVENKREQVRALESRGQYREALKEYGELIKVADEKEAREIRNRIGMMIKGRPYLAELPEEARRHALRAEVLTKEGKFEDAVREYREAIKMAPFFAALYKAAALNYAELKEYRQAISNLKIYLDLSPDAPDARVAKDEIYKWEFMLERGGK